MDTLTLHLEPEQDLLLSLSEVAQEKQISGFLLGVVGNLSKASFQCPGRDQPTVLEGELEIITLNGTFDADGVHLHLSLSDGACQGLGRPSRKRLTDTERGGSSSGNSQTRSSSAKQNQNTLRDCGPSWMSMVR